MGRQPLGGRQAPDRLPDRGETLLVDALDLRVSPERLDGERVGGSREPARGQDVVGAGRVVASRLGRPRPDEDRARMTDPRDGCVRVADVDRKVLWRVGVDEGDGGLEAGSERDPAVRREGAGQDRLTLETRQEGGDLLLDRVGQGSARGRARPG
jgi:hypothetical protein